MTCKISKMHVAFCLSFYLFLMINALKAQSIGINITTPDASAALDITSTSTGVLIPRMTTAQRTAISNPAIGLLVYDSSLNAFYFYNGTAWTAIHAGKVAVNYVGTSFLGQTSGAGSTGTSEGTASNLHNIAIGQTVLNANTYGPQNVGLGFEALKSNTVGGFNQAIGYKTLSNNTEGAFNNAMGYQSLINNTSGAFNQAIGYKTMQSNVNGSYNNALGGSALLSNTVGSNNVALGQYSLQNNTIGSNNVSVGTLSGTTNITGSSNTFLGSAANVSADNLSNATAVGAGAIVGASNSLVLGNNANVGIGVSSPAEKLHVLGNMRIDGGKLQFSNTETSIYIGERAGNTDAIGDGFELESIGIGTEALYSTKTGFQNIAIGLRSLKNMADGETNVAVGVDALNQSTIGSGNTAIGGNAGENNQTGEDNTFVGSFSGQNNDGSENTFIGSFAGYNSTGSSNVMIGYQAGENETGNSKLYIDNSSTSLPLIWGDFTNNYLTVNGKFGVGTSTFNSESNLIISGMDASEGGQLQLNSSTSGRTAYFIDNYQDAFRIMSGANSGSSNVQFYMNSSGNIGIGTSSPTKAKVEINGFTNFPTSGTAYRYYNNSTQSNGSTTATTPYSLYASDRIGASEFNAFSDRRIKKILRGSNSTEDLATLMKIKITDYKLIDSIQKGNKEYKKVIAQELAEVYPNAVSNITDVVPDIYKLATVKDNFISLPNHTLKVGDKVKLISSNTQNLYTVLKINNLGFYTEGVSDGQIFVFGKEVNDFHTVDYEALSTLNISATQELVKQLNDLKAQNEALKTKVEKAETDIEALKAAVFGSQNTPSVLTVKK